MENQSRDYLETTLRELLTAIDEVAGTSDEAFAILESMLAEGRISLRRQPGHHSDRRARRG